LAKDAPANRSGVLAPGVYSRGSVRFVVTRRARPLTDIVTVCYTCSSMPPRVLYATVAAALFLTSCVTGMSPESGASDPANPRSGDGIRGDSNGGDQRTASDQNVDETHGGDATCGDSRTGDANHSDSLGADPYAGNSAPVANAGVDQAVFARQEVVLTGLGSTDADGDQLVYRWSIAAAPSGSVAGLSGSATATARVTPDLAGTYVIRLAVNDGHHPDTTDTATVTALVNDSTNLISAYMAAGNVEVENTEFTPTHFDGANVKIYIGLMTAAITSFINDSVAYATTINETKPVSKAEIIELFNSYRASQCAFVSVDAAAELINFPPDMPQYAADHICANIQTPYDIALLYIEALTPIVSDPVDLISRYMAIQNSLFEATPFSGPNQGSEITRYVNVMTAAIQKFVDDSMAFASMVNGRTPVNKLGLEAVFNGYRASQTAFIPTHASTHLAQFTPTLRQTAIDGVTANVPGIYDAAILEIQGF
jgi:hypothetical protein